MSQVNLHSHTEGSFLDGEARPKRVFERAKELGLEYVAFTDHGECNQHLIGAKLAKQHGLGFIPGIEGYWLTAEKLAWSRENKKPPSPSHICLLAASQKGLSNLWALSSLAYTEDYFYRKPNATTELLAEYSEGLYASDGCMMTDFAAAIDGDREDEARQILGTLLNIFKDRLYMELHTWQFVDAVTEEQIRLNTSMTKINQGKLRLATELGVPLVVVNDNHHAFPQDWVNKELVWAFNTSDDSDKLRQKIEAMAQKADHLMGEEELYLWMRKHGIPDSVVAEAVKNSYEIAQNCKVEIKQTLTMPQMAKDEMEDLRNLITACGEGFRKYVVDEGLDQDRYLRRLEEELGLIADKRFAGYFNMVRDYTMAFRSGSWAGYVKKNAPPDPQLIGPARGSAGGSLVAYLTGITIIDPIKYGTLFGRFLSPGRKGLPDIDVDVSQSQRPELVKYFPARFGEENVCVIGTLNRNGPKATLRDLGRAMKIPREDINKISQHIEELERLRDPDNPDEEDLTFSELIERKGTALKPWVNLHPELFKKMEEMSGRVRHPGVHAAGILASSTPLRGAVPMRRTKNEVTTTQFDMWEIEELGGVKLDLLGIRHLDTLSHARQLIYERHGVWIDYDRTGLSVPQGCTNVLRFGDSHFNDPEIWPQIDKGRTTGIFQVCTPNCTQSAVVFKPRSEKDIADLTSIIRPGVADAGLKDVYLRRRGGLEPVVYEHPLMESITGPGWVTNTYGVLVYQEQIIECVQQLAGFTDDEADDLRKAVGKKLMDKLMALKDKFVQGCLSNPDYVSGCGSKKPSKVAETIWHNIEASGRYAFNWSHAVGYAMIATWEIWTKYYYPQEFLVASMATDSASINLYIREARRCDIRVLPPDVNKSTQKFTIEGGHIRYGLDTVRGVGAVACEHIAAGRPYSSFEDYLSRAGKGAGKTAVYNLILIGAFDEMGARNEILDQLERTRILDDVSPNKLAKLTEDEKDAIWQDKRVRLAHRYRIERPDFDNSVVVYEIEKELVGTYVTVDPMGRYLKALDGVVLMDPFDIHTKEIKEKFVIGGQVTAITPTVTKKGRNPGQEMAHITVNWNEADFRIVVFPEAWGRVKRLIELGAPVACEVAKLDSGCCLERVERLDLLFDREGIE